MSHRSAPNSPRLPGPSSSSSPSTSPVDGGLYSSYPRPPSPGRSRYAYAPGSTNPGYKPQHPPRLNLSGTRSFVTSPSSLGPRRNDPPTSATPDHTTFYSDSSGPPSPEVQSPKSVVPVPLYNNPTITAVANAAITTTARGWSTV
ncbi:hypothetical protein GMORB2_7415 [Geosmithia morbida]|uniref:Uncharacterized protein n=1 Tax=Geosmithia morbida TaxID=1094350 RepID=A0A9P4YSQ7_9HYPO|nr:uncharacterized protein GMORB2_7415 [Geosmithia morbida]KAF4122423.1 hypothetical protein GMORB2_7415 [Geosmithia morbida]